MPNWCSNSIVITGDKEKIKKIKRVLQTRDTKDTNTGVFQILVGRDENLSESQFENGAWYQHNIDRFGCKWDIDYDESNIDTDGDECITMSQLADMLIKISGKKIEKRYLPAGPAGCMRRNSDNTKIQKLTDWKPSYLLDQGLKNTYEFIKDQLTEK